MLHKLIYRHHLELHQELFQDGFKNRARFCAIMEKLINNDWNFIHTIFFIVIEFLRWNSLEPSDCYVVFWWCFKGGDISRISSKRSATSNGFAYAKDQVATAGWSPYRLSSSTLTIFKRNFSNQQRFQRRLHVCIDEDGNIFEHLL